MKNCVRRRMVLRVADVGFRPISFSRLPVLLANLFARRFDTAG